jgi:pimeloyl-ACP methyl ester carboxylesterase
MENFTKLLAVTLYIFSLSGCTSIGSYVMSNPDIYLSEAQFIKAKPSDIGFEKHTFCSFSTTQCITYLTAESYQAAEFSQESSVYYNLHATGNNVENTISHRMTPDTFNRFKGTALLLHGYGGSKEAMMASAIYFRALGMNVIIPDLFGHGESTEAFVFATKEHGILNELLAEPLLNQTNNPTVVVGHSMGALTASNLLSSEYVDAAILLAPMMSFDVAAKEYLPYKSPLLSHFFHSEIDNIVSQAMFEAGVTIQETNLLPKLTETKKPVLLINSDVDSLSPPAYFSSIQNELVKKITFNARSHSSLMVFDRDDVIEIENWLITW